MALQVQHSKVAGVTAIRFLSCLFSYTTYKRPHNTNVVKNLEIINQVA